MKKDEIKTGKTAYRKTIEKHLLRTLADGSMVLQVDRVWGHEITPPPGIIDAQDRGCDVVFNPNKIKTMIDHVNPAKDTASAIQGRIMRVWSRKHNIEFLDVGRNGICHAIIPEKGWIYPGQIGIMGDSHTCTHGAFCAFTAGVGTTDSETGVITGLWVCPPQKVIRVNFIGKLPANVFAKDIILALIKKIGVDGATNAVLEFGGSVIRKMSMEGRMTIANMAVEAGATSGMMMVDERMIDYLWPAIIRNYPDYPRSISYSTILADLQRFNSDPDAEYDQVIEIDVSNMVPVTTINYSPGDVVNVAEFAGKQVDQVYIGSCTNGRIEDLRIAAMIFSLIGGKVADNIRCIVVPATQYIYQRALVEGLIEIFIKAGCFVSGPTCGACLGMSCGVLAPGEVCVSTTNRNYRKRMGEGGMVHLVSPATAALTALKGEITEPTVEMCETVLKYHFIEKAAVQLTDWKEKPFETPDYGSLLSSVGAEKDRDFSGKAFFLKNNSAIDTAEAKSPKKNADTDEIIPAKYLNEIEKKKFGEHCLEGAPMSSEDRKKLYKSAIIVAGKNFACGSSREHAPWAIEGAGIGCVIAQSFARIFENNMFNNGLLCITLPKEIIERLFNEEPEDLLVDWKKGIIEWGDNNCVEFEISERRKDLIKNGGSVGIMLKLAAELQAEGKI
ncbi:3-isopropylmalate dehydratase large subunit [Candidatus Parcubacteria bacterium]|nr:3-isopropylmalate dehydratase large subunit [Candidatus Parcubacteria bacterium]